MKRQKQFSKDSKQQGAVSPDENRHILSPAPYLCILVDRKIILKKVKGQRLPEFALNFICDKLPISYPTHKSVYDWWKKKR